MRASTYLKELASMLELTYVEKVKPFESKKDPMLAMNYEAGSLIGVRRGFLAVVSLISCGHDSQLCILLRYPNVADLSALSAAIQNAFGVSKLGFKTAKVESDCLMLHWRYAIRKPAKEEVVRMLDEVIAALSLYAQPFSGKCEQCAEPSTGGIMLLNGLPCYLCPACQQRSSEGKQREAGEYANRKMGFLRAFGLAALAAALCAFALSWLYYWLDDDGQLPIKLIVLAPIWIGVIVAIVFAKTAKRIDIRKQAVPLFVLSFVLSFAATVGYSVLLNSPGTSASSLWWTSVTMAIMWFAFHLQGGGMSFVLGYTISAGCCVALVRECRPKFKQNFVPLSEAAFRAEG